MEEVNPSFIGRDVYQPFLIQAYDSYAVNEFINAIRFSTHGNYYCKNVDFDILGHNFPHLHLYENQNLEFYRYLTFRHDHFIITDVQDFAFEIVNSADIFFPDYSSFLDEYQQLDFIVNPDLSIEYICSVDKDGKAKHHYISIDTVIPNLSSMELKLKPSSIITIKTGEIGSSSFVLHVNRFSNTWRLYRSLGINIPLLIIQVCLDRMVKTTQMVDSDAIVIENSTIKYRFQKDTFFWFDLDETLVCRWMPIKQLVKFLQTLKSVGFNVGLITRHTYEITETLSKIGLSNKLFDKIVKVELHQKKSSFISASNVFIDNDFKERLDVRSNTGAMVLDLDQIDFISVKFG